jgi:hypothetical protein
MTVRITPVQKGKETSPRSAGGDTDRGTLPPCGTTSGMRQGQRGGATFQLENDKPLMEETL